MFIAINNKGDYQEFPYAKTIDQAKDKLKTKFTPEEIKKYEWEVIDDNERKC